MYNVRALQQQFFLHDWRRHDPSRRAARTCI